MSVIKPCMLPKHHFPQRASIAEREWTCNYTTKKTFKNEKNRPEASHNLYCTE